MSLLLLADNRLRVRRQLTVGPPGMVAPCHIVPGPVSLLPQVGLELKDFFVNVDFSRGDVWLGKVKLPVEKGNLQYINLEGDCSEK